MNKRRGLSILCFIFGHNWEKCWHVLVDPLSAGHIHRMETEVWECKRCPVMVAGNTSAPFDINVQPKMVSPMTKHVFDPKEENTNIGEICKM